MCVWDGVEAFVVVAEKEKADLMTKLKSLEAEGLDTDLTYRWTDFEDRVRDQAGHVLLTFLENIINVSV